MQSLIRNYKIRAIAGNGDSSLLSTESRERAISYFRALEAGKHWKEVRIELGVEVYRAENLEKLP